MKHGPSPELLTTAANNGLNANGLTGGILGEPGTVVLFTGRDLDFGAFTGARAKAGVHMGPEGFWSFEVGGFYLPKRSVDFAAAGGSNGTPLLTIPFLDSATGNLSSLDVNAQDGGGNPYLVGRMAIHSDLQVWGYEINLIAHSIRTSERSVDLVMGFRSLGLNENLSINQTLSPALTGNVTLQFPNAGQGVAFYYNVLANTPAYVSDHFSTRNLFNGPQVGGRFNFARGPFSADLNVKVAVGITHQRATIEGSSTAALAEDPNAQTIVANLTTPGGVFALQNNSGSFSQNQFTIVPEVGFNLRCEVTSWLRVHAGYNALYWSNVARPGGQIDGTLNSKLIPTGALLPTNTNPVGVFVPGSEQGRPYFVFRDTAFWAHGINVGVEFRY